ncbi:MAG: restriction endonuclease subunit S [Thermodesulfobacteriota bacterium]
MSTKWPKVKLGEVMRRSGETIELLPDVEYREVTVRLWGNGVVERRRVLGNEIAGSRRFVARAGQFIVSRIDARNGAMGIIPHELEGAVVTNDFPLFTLKEMQLLPEFIGGLCRTRDFVELCQKASEGTTNRVRLKEDRFLTLEIPLPPLAEQRRIVAKIHQLAAKIAEARGLRQQAAEEAEHLLIFMAHRRDLDDEAKKGEGWQRVSLGEVLGLVDDSHRVLADRSYPNLGIYSFAHGLFPKPPIDGALTSATTLRRVRKGQFIYSRLFAFEGAYGMVTKEYDGFFVSNEYPTFDCDFLRMRTEFVAAYFKSPEVWKEVAVGSKGLGDRRQRVQPAQVLSHRLWLPPLEWQNTIAEVQAEVEALKRMQAETIAKIDALLPSILDKAFKGKL